MAHWAMCNESVGGALRGLKVTVANGPSASRLLSDMRAEVIHVETPHHITSRFVRPANDGGYLLVGGL
jgi:crotonobetainyl-CoA:carnitine CoA-transferase CaiB-like acyl-CoA transferase